MLKQLSTQDASFVFMESAATPMHIGALYIYDPTESPFGDLTEERISAFWESRLHLWPLTRQRLVRVPFDADYPYWIEDKDFDIEYHLRRIALPKPADWQTLNTICARIFSRPLDFSRPLWEVYLIEGLDHLEGVPPGAFACLTKTHHAAIDGATGQHLVELMHDLTPEPRDVPLPSRPWRPDPVPSDAELMFRSGVNNLSQPFRFARVLAESAGKLPSVLRSLPGVKPPTLQVPPATRFNGSVSAHRVVGQLRLPLDRIRKLRTGAAGATVNDVVLAICGGALRAYLGAKQELPGDSLVAMAPVNVRTGGPGAAGNRVSALFVPIGTELEDPLARLRAIRSATHSSKEINNAVGARLMTDYSQFVPAFTAAMAGRLMTTMTNGTSQPGFNLSITNVPGPQVPLYFMGAKMVTNFGLGPISHGMGLIMPITSYCGDLVIGFTSCRDMLPDPEFFTECLARSYESLAAAVAAATEQSEGVTA